MNILLVYATNSGTTMMTTQTIADVLTQESHTVTVKEAREIEENDIVAYDAIILGSPSWDYEGKEGMPHEDFVPLIEKLKTQSYEDKRFAVFGLGDSSYRVYCGAVDHLEELVKTVKGKLIVPSLKIDNFFASQNKHMETIRTWSESLAQKLTT